MEAIYMDQVTSAIDNLRRETRHDLRDLRATVQALADVFTENAKSVVKVEGEIALLEQKCSAMGQKVLLMKAEIDVLDADVSCLKKDKARLSGSWQALTTVAVVASGLSALLIKWVGV